MDLSADAVARRRDAPAARPRRAGPRPAVPGARPRAGRAEGAVAEAVPVAGRRAAADPLDHRVQFGNRRGEALHLADQLVAAFEQVRQDRLRL